MAKDKNKKKKEKERKKREKEEKKREKEREKKKKKPGRCKLMMIAIRAFFWRRYDYEIYHDPVWKGSCKPGVTWALKFLTIYAKPKVPDDPTLGEGVNVRKQLTFMFLVAWFVVAYGTFSTLLVF